MASYRQRQRTVGSVDKEAGLELIVTTKKGNKKIVDVVKVKNNWIPRWSFLNDLVNDMAVTTLEWDRTALAPLLQWVALNERMDNSWSPSPILQLPHISPMNEVIDFMNPASGEYLLYCWIDDELLPERRRQLYLDLGIWIRSQGLNHSFTYLQPIDELEDGLHYNFHLSRDMAYGLPELDRRDYPAGLLDSILDSPLNVLTGIVHVAWMWVNSLHYKTRAEVKIMKEVPWNVIRWNDVVQMASEARVYSQEALLDFSIVFRKGAITYMTGGIPSSLREQLENDKSPDKKIELLVAALVDPNSHLSRYSTGIEEQLNLRLLLAGRDPSGMGIPRDTLPDSRLRIMEDRNDKVTVIAPAASLLIERLARWTVKTESDAITRLILANETGYRNTKMTKTDLEDVLSLLVMRVAWDGSPEQSGIDSSEYSYILDRILGSLGTSVIQAISTSAVEFKKHRLTAYNPRMRRIYGLKADLLYRAASQLLESNEEREFVDWPVVRRS